MKSLDFSHEESEEDHYSQERRMDLAEGHVIPFAEGDDDRSKGPNVKG